MGWKVGAKGIVGGVEGVGEDRGEATEGRGREEERRTVGGCGGGGELSGGEEGEEGTEAQPPALPLPITTPTRPRPTPSPPPPPVSPISPSALPP